MKKRFFLTPTPSISVSSWFMTLSPAPPASPMDEPRDVPMESSSSKKSTQGAAARALSNTSRTLASDSPNLHTDRQMHTDGGVGVCVCVCRGCACVYVFVWLCTVCTTW